MSEPSERDKLFHYIFTTALEGGVQYWARVEKYHLWDESLPGHVEDWDGFYAEIEDDDDVSFRVDRSVIARGYGLAVSSWRERIAWSSERPPIVISDHLEDWDYDAGDADVIVQLGLFGDVVYG